MHGKARRRARGAIAVGVLLLFVALVSAMAVAADVPPDRPTGDFSNNHDNRDVLEGWAATRYAQPPPPTPLPGIIGAYYPFVSQSQTLGTPLPSPTPPPFSGTQDDHSLQHSDDRG